MAKLLCTHVTRCGAVGCNFQEEGKEWAVAPVQLPSASRKLVKGIAVNRKFRNGLAFTPGTAFVHSSPASRILIVLDLSVWSGCVYLMHRTQHSAENVPVATPN